MHPMTAYHDLLQRILDEGEYAPNQRTGIGTRRLNGEILRFDMRDGFPAITTKRLAWKACKGELLGMLRGADSAATFRDLGCKVWDQNANENTAWLANPHRRGTDDLGRSYGPQWTDWASYRVGSTPVEAADLLASGYQPHDGAGAEPGTLMRRGINQLEEAHREILRDPSTRRAILNGWRPDEHDQSALPVCHLLYQWHPTANTGRLHQTLYMRSWDVFLAFNIPLAALLLHIMARLTGYEPGRLTIMAGDAHIYDNQVDAVRELLSREHRPQPTLWIDPSIVKVDDSAEAAAVMARLRPEQFELQGYDPHPAIPAPMAV